MENSFPKINNANKQFNVCVVVGHLARYGSNFNIMNVLKYEVPSNANITNMLNFFCLLHVYILVNIGNNLEPCSHCLDVLYCSK
jgi:hypothetical protein